MSKPSHFIPCGVWEAVYILDGLLKNSSDIQPDTIYADTQGAEYTVACNLECIRVRLADKALLSLLWLTYWESN